MEKEKKLIANRIQTPDGTILWSRHRHDCVMYEDANGETYMVDGGNDYCRTTDNKVYARNLSLFDDEPWDIQRQVRLRGVYNSKTGNLQWVPLNKLSNDHIDNIIKDEKEYHSGRDNSYISIYEIERNYRIEHNIVINEHDYADEEIQPISKETVCLRYLY